MLATGQVVDKYEVLGDLGGGGMARIYKVRHVVLGSLHALKVLEPHHAARLELRRRFLHEGQVQSRLRHPNIAAVTDIVEQPGVAGLVVEFVNGSSLDAYIASRGGTTDPRAVKDVFLPVLAALGHAHAHGVVHRDVKPSNIMIGRDAAGAACPKLLDFGIAKIQREFLGEQQVKASTRTGARLGTSDYMSPEQVKGARDVDVRSDTYSLTVTLYQFVSGRLPFEADNEFETLRRIVDGNPTPLRAFVPGVDATLERSVTKGMAHDPAARFQTCEEFAAALVRAGEPIPRPDPPPPRRSGARREASVAPGERTAVESAARTPPDHTPRRGRTLLVGGVAAALVLVGGVTAVLVIVDGVDRPVDPPTPQPTSQPNPQPTSPLTTCLVSSQAAVSNDALLPTVMSGIQISWGDEASAVKRKCGLADGSTRGSCEIVSAPSNWAQIRDIRFTKLLFYTRGGLFRVEIWKKRPEETWAFWARLEGVLGPAQYRTDAVGTTRTAHWTRQTVEMLANQGILSATHTGLRTEYSAREGRPPCQEP